MTEKSDAPHTHDSDALTRFHWEPQPEAQKLVNELLEAFLDRNSAAAELAEAMKNESATRFADWIDTIFVPASKHNIIERLEEVGYEPFETELAADVEACWYHPGGLFPMIATLNENMHNVALKVESVADFLAAHHVPITEETIGGEPLERTRWACAFAEDGAELWVIERHGYKGMAETNDPPALRVAALKHLERFRTRKRDFGVGPQADQRGIDEAHRLVDEAIEEIGRDWACDLFFAAERDYWMRRNTAARVQKARQDRLGLGWGNHDHHTYRGGRGNYARVVALFEKMGFYCRERFYAGIEAGWGAQVLEQPVTGIVIFFDVDMSPDEIRGDFPHEGFGGHGFTDKEDLGTIGLWVELHGESLLQAGMHHLEAMFDWHALVEQLETEADIKTMAPFTTFPYLRQAFTQGEMWPVEPARLEALVNKGHLTNEQADRFRLDGALGSHLENLERNDGFRGFNQQGVSDIISRTDARKQAPSSA